jgi:hypothetical protein
MTATTDEESMNSFDAAGGGNAVEKKGAPGNNHKDQGFCVSRNLVVLVLLASAAIAGSLTYVFVKDNEDDDYRRQVRWMQGSACT